VGSNTTFFISGSGAAAFDALAFFTSGFSLALVSAADATAPDA
jgi:hypothetical protein